MTNGIIALYIRLSIEDEKYDSLSVENQQLILREKALSLPEYSNAEIIEFVDNGHSGTNFERPAVQELLQMVQMGKINCIIVKDFSRFGRNSIETGYFIEKVFPIYHVRFISVSDDYDSNDYKGDTGGVDIAFKYLINECYSRDISVKIRTAKLARMKRGEHQNVNCPYGYIKGSDGKMIPDEETAGNVKMIFELAAAGYNTPQIAQKLYDLHIPTPGEYKVGKIAKEYDVSRSKGVWLANAVIRIIRDERYIGTYIAGKSRSTKVGGSERKYIDESEWIKIPEHHTPIISKELFDKANGAFPKREGVATNKLNYLLKGKVFCGCCGHALRVVRTYHYCNYSVLIKTLPCRGLRFPIKDLEQTVFQTIRTQMSFVFGIGAAKDKADMLLAQQEEHSEKLNFLRDRKRELYEQYTLGVIDIETYKSQKADVEAQIASEKNVSAAVSAEAKTAIDEYEQGVKQKEICDELNAADTLTKSLIDKLIKRVYVFPDNRIEIEYTIKDFLTK